MLSIQVPTLKTGFTFRPGTLEDAPAVVEIMRACDIAVVGTADASLQDLLNDWRMPGMNLENDTRVIAAPDGRLVGYVIVQDVIRPVNPELDAYVHPDFWEDTVGVVLMQWVEDRTRQAIPKAPADARVAMQAFTYNQDKYYKSLLEQAGMQVARHFFHMAIELDQPLMRPEWPERISLRLFQAGEDKRPVLEAQRDSFQDHWGHVEQPFDEQYARWTQFWDENFNPSLWFLAMDGDKIAGICLCRGYRGEDEMMGWVNTLGVTRPYRRLGVGRALLLHAFHEMKSRGKTRVGLGVDASSLTGATRLYEKAGMHVAEVIDLYEKELRPGVVYGTQSVE
ncbi:MAG: GNAT family N-acetyltransferase [Chloroflexota bacterium]